MVLSSSTSVTSSGVGNTWALRWGANITDAHWHYGSTDYVGKASIAECVQAVRTGEVIGFAYDEPILTYIADQSAAEFDVCPPRMGSSGRWWADNGHVLTAGSLFNMQVIGEPFYKQNYGIAIQRGLANGTFQRAVSEELLILRESGVIDRLEQTWFPPVCAAVAQKLAPARPSTRAGMPTRRWLFLFRWMRRRRTTHPRCTSTSC